MRPHAPSWPIAPIVFLAALTALAPATARAQKPPERDAECCGYYVGGTVFYDADADGVQDPGENGLAGWTVEAVDAGLSVLMTTVTDAAGYYQFGTPVACGVTFYLREVLQSGWTRTYPTGTGMHAANHVACSFEVFGPYDFGNIPPACQGVTEVYTTDPEFNLGALNGVVTAGDQLELAPTPTTFEHAWIANAGEGTLSKVSTVTGKEVARYYTGPPDGTGNFYYLSPSRTVVDRDGHCWVANRTLGDLPSITQIVTDGGEDRSGNGIIETSADLNNNGIIEPTEMLPWGQDERVVRFYLIGNVPTNGARAFAIDKTGKLWVGLSAEQRVAQILPDHPTSVYAPGLPPTVVPEEASVSVGFLPYGLALSPSGMLYLSTAGSRAIEIDPGPLSGGTAAGPAVTQIKNHGPSNYGIAVDQDCIVWLAYNNPSNTNHGVVRWDPTVGVGNPLLGWSLGMSPAIGRPRGVTVDFNGNIWVGTNGINNVAKFDDADPPNFLGTWPTAAPTPVGVGIGPDGNLIVTGQGSPLWQKHDVATGAPIPLPGPELAGPAPYTYSDFTGHLQAITSQQQGFWTVVTDGGSNSLLWILVDWNDLVPPGTGVQVEARTAYNLPALAAAPWTTVFPPGPLAVPMPGRYIETRVRLTREADCGAAFVTPVLYDLTVEAICDTCAFASCPADTVVACQSPDGAAVAYTPPVLYSGCDTTFVVTCVPPSGSMFPMGSTPVVCTAVNAVGDTVRCEFTVSVTQDCAPTITGGCCVDDVCMELTETECALSGGAWLGEVSDCADGCGDPCAHPPAGIVGWWPLDGASGGVTPNLADPGTGGTLVGPPTPLAGQVVNASYGFNGATQYVQVPHAPALNVGPADLTVDAWVRTTGSSGVQPIVDKRDASPIQGFAFYLNDGYPAVQIAAGGSFTNFALDAVNGGPAAFVADGRWHFVAVTVDRNDPAGIRFYVDGAPVGSPLDPTARQGSLNSSATLLIARSHPILVASRYFRGALDEIEVMKREATAEEIAAIFAAGGGGKCRDACYATSRALCCDGNAANSLVTICNYDVVSHVYSWGLSPIGAGPGCSGAGPVNFVPANGTVTIAAGDCVTIPVQILCPTAIPAGQASCYQVTVFNHDTGRYFGCTGSVRRPALWCWKWKMFDATPAESVVDLAPGVTHRLDLAVSHLEPLPDPVAFDVTLVPEEGHGGAASGSLALNGLPPGKAWRGSVPVGDGEEATIAVDVSYPEHQPIGYDRIVILVDEDMDGTPEPIGELAVRSSVQATTGAGWEDPPPGEDAPARPFLTLPNPFSASGRIRFRVEGEGPQETSLRVHDLRGRVVKTLLRWAMLDPGLHTVEWDGSDDLGRTLPGGMYFLRLETPEGKESVKVVLTR